MQIVVLETAPLDLVDRVLRDGRVLLDRNPRRRHEFEIRAMSLHYDFGTTMEPILYPKRA